jgi:hypothetical protein
MYFDFEELFYVNTGLSPLIFGNPSITSGSRIDDLKGLSRRVVIVGREDLPGKRGLLRASEKFEVQNAVPSGAVCRSDFG